MEAEIICTFACTLEEWELIKYDGLSDRILKFCGKFLGKLFFLCSYCAF
jgi:hypothetical protein